MEQVDMNKQVKDALKNAHECMTHQINVILAIKAELSGIDDEDLTHAEKKIKKIISNWQERK